MPCATHVLQCLAFRAASCQLAFQHGATCVQLCTVSLLVRCLRTAQASSCTHRVWSRIATRPCPYAHAATRACRGRLPNALGHTRQQSTRVSLSNVRGSIVVSISACHAEDPGSIPGRGDLLLFVWSICVAKFIPIAIVFRGVSGLSRLTGANWSHAGLNRGPYGY